ncbi:MAG TPA: ABC transporter substrate-binding protein, partial [Abditibacteriaceae bacterium]|nr:ABC transporter substrate-binding protein [Abditibacteriaceae bacterium]
MAVKSDVSTLDPALSYDSGSMPYVRVLYRGLIDYGAGADFVNAVAKERKVSPDGKVYSFKLRTDVRFHSGRRVVAEDFRYAVERVLTPATASDGFAFYQIIDGAPEFSADKKKPKSKQRIEHVRGIRVTGDDEISFTLK